MTYKSSLRKPHSPRFIMANLSDALSFAVHLNPAELIAPKSVSYEVTVSIYVLVGTTAVCKNNSTRSVYANLEKDSNLGCYP